MHDIATIAALEWARTNSRHGEDPSTFGANVAKAYFACWDATPASAAELEAAQQIDAMFQAMQSARVEVRPSDDAIDLVRCAGLSDLFKIDARGVSLADLMPAAASRRVRSRRKAYGRGLRPAADWQARWRLRARRALAIAEHTSLPTPAGGLSQ